jgi:hypothetical protein
MLFAAALLTLSTRRTEAVDVGVGVTAFLLFAAAAAVGAVLGFLFGLPRARLTDQLSGQDASASAASPGATGPASHYLANSNLIKVSDWLTTIVIGLGLVNLGSAVPALRTLAAALERPLGGAPYAGAIGVCTLLAGCIGGFMLAYLYTSIRVRQLLEDSDRQTEAVPPLRGLRLDEAERAMSLTGLRLSAPPDAAQEQVIIEQEPPAGERLPLGSAVAVQLRPEPVAAALTRTTVEATTLGATTLEATTVRATVSTNGHSPAVEVPAPR